MVCSSHLNFFHNVVRWIHQRMDELKSKSFIISVVVAVALIGITLWLYQMISGVSETIAKGNPKIDLLTENNNVLLREREQNRKTLADFSKTATLVERQNARIDYLTRCIAKMGTSIKKTDADFKLPRSNERRVRMDVSDDEDDRSDYSEEDYEESPRESRRSSRGSRDSRGGSRGQRDVSPGQGPPPSSELEEARERRRRNQNRRSDVR